MSVTDVLTIGSVIKHRGEYSNDTTYYFNNQVTMCGSIFQALGNNFSAKAPLSIAKDSTVSLSNTSLWKCIIDNVNLYNATLSANNINDRVVALEGSVDKIKSTAQDANAVAQSASANANAAVTAVNSMKQYLTITQQQITNNSSRIDDNAAAISALQNKVSPLKVVCGKTAIGYTPDDNGEMKVSIPIYIYDDDEDVTSESTVSPYLFSPTQIGLVTSWDGSAANTVVVAPGRHVLKVSASHKGKSVNVEINVYMTLPITVTYNSGDLDTKYPTVTAKTLPVKISVAKTGRLSSKLLFNVPSYLNAKKITCNGVMVPISIDTASKTNYMVISTMEDVIPGNYDFLIE